MGQGRADRTVIMEIILKLLFKNVTAKHTQESNHQIGLCFFLVLSALSESVFWKWHFKTQNRATPPGGSLRQIRADYQEDGIILMSATAFVLSHMLTF